MNRKIIMIFIFLICLGNLRALDIAITDKEIEGCMNAEFNRTLFFIGGLSETVRIEFNDRLAVKGGGSLGWARDITDIKLFANAAYRPLANLPLEVKFAWVYDDMPEFEVYSNAIAPFISWNAKYVGISVGIGFRLTSFFGERNLFELLLPIKVYANFINNEKICFGMSFANFNDFRMDSFISFVLGLNVSFRIDELLAIVSELEYKHSGADGLTSAFYGIAWKGGVKFKW